MIGLFLFGPEKYRSILNTVRGPKQSIADDIQCLDSTWDMFYEHCGCLPKHCFERVRAFGNMCNYATDKAAIKEALAFACGMDRINPLTVNVKKPSILRVTPSPVRGSSEYCERVAVEGVSRLKLGSFSKKYHVLLQPSDKEWHDEEAQICVHRDASLGLCECAKEDWIYLKNKQWSFVMSPYEQVYVEVKLSPQARGFVSVYLAEVSQGWRYMLLAIGFSFLFLAPVASKWLPYCSNFTRILIVRVTAITLIFQGSFDTVFAMVAVVTCLALYLKIKSILPKVVLKRWFSMDT
ncbi:hypothetical protein CTI12_AA112340 [Artemisia annua]|uniref:Legumain prodomain domain-containing protein n=1 Tax=Artemisia annua TaxID=35608 RepID=A0A2U1PUK0_ARTAN|nr:hypothetical protein CTI12_AA112340 [Artemisia annua]